MGGAERGLGLLELEARNLKLAEAHLRCSRNIFDQLGWIKMASSSKILLGFIAAAEGRVEEASEVLLESLAYQDREQDAHSIAHVLFILGLLAAEHGDEDVAGYIFSQAEVIQQEFDVALPPHLHSAVEHAKQALPSVDEIPGLTWKECVQLILLHPQNWLSTFAGALKAPS